MGRELKRVSLEFSWPLNEPWKGYINDRHTATKCAACDGDGASSEARRLKHLWYGHEPFKPEDRGSAPLTIVHSRVRAFAERNITHAPDFYGSGEAAIVRESQRLCNLWNGSWSHHLNQDDVDALVTANRLWDFTRTWTAGTGWKDKEPPYRPTAQEVNDWSLSGFGHDSINQWVVVEAECKRLGVPDTCAACDGEGEVWPSADAKSYWEAWEKTEPPIGNGFQIWETVSEGSPISPVLSSPEDLARHMASTKWGADDGTSYETWLAFINGPGWAPSMAGTSAGMQSGVEAIVAMNT